MVEMRIFGEYFMLNKILYKLYLTQGSKTPPAEMMAWYLTLSHGAQMATLLHPQALRKRQAKRALLMQGA